jgi:hypothetical protein
MAGSGGPPQGEDLMPHSQRRIDATCFAVVFGLLGLAAAPASAVTYQRTFVASTGIDTNQCRLVDPCRSFNAAIAQTTSGGEVVILDTAGYGPMVINKAIKVIGPSGVYGGISVLGGVGPPPPPVTGIVINAGDTDVVTLRGLDISGVPGAAPLPLIGIDIQNAGAVHIERSSIGNFTQDASACVKVNVARAVGVYVDDSFLRECRTGIYVNGSAGFPNSPSVMVNNTQIQVGSGTVVYGIWAQGSFDVRLRNSTISGQDVGVQMDGFLAAPASLKIINSELTQNWTALRLTNTTTGAHAILSLEGSQIVGANDAMLASNSASGATNWVQIADSSFSYATNGLTLSNSATGSTWVELARSHLGPINGTSIGLDATNGGQMQLNVRDSTLSGGNTLLKTSGTASPLHVSLIRSNLSLAGTAIDHGQGSIELDSTHVNSNLKDFVNNGSPTIVSNGQNMVNLNVNAPGPVYITPSVIGLK